MLFRYHRGGLAESLETTINIKDKQELYKILQDELKRWNFFFNIEDIECIDYGYDNRCNWQTYLISIKNFGVVGMTNVNVESEVESE